MAHVDADRNLLFGLLALQNNFIDRNALLDAFNRWVHDRAVPLGRILIDRSALKPDEHDLLQALVGKHLEKFGGDPEKSLQQLSSMGSVRGDLSRIADDDLLASLAHVSAARSDDDPYRTVTQPNLGESTSTGSRFRVLRPHARGGLGQVSVALDQELDRPVALKEIQDRHADEPHSRARFVQEAEITGKLEHPGIIPVYGLGHDASGRPFYAMRFIQGDSLKEAIMGFHGDEGLKKDPGRGSRGCASYCGGSPTCATRSPTRHSRGVLHRDLKPGNIMLGPYGETLVVDWGLAKPIGPSGAGESAARDAPVLMDGPIRLSGLRGSRDETDTGSIIGTPAYASPEQVAGRLDLLGPASDVYGLGATLYALLTGRAPVESGELEDVLRRVQRGEVRPPRALDPTIPRPLEALCQRAMATRPEDRYASARELAADVIRWLDDQPVTAWSEPLAIRLSRWGRRHRSLVIALGVAFFVASALMSVGALLLSKERDRAMENLKESRRVVGAMFDKVVPKLTDQREMDSTQRDILESALRFYEDFVLRRDRDPAVRHEVGRAYQRIANIENRLGRSRAAETAYLRGLAVLDPLVAEHPTSLEYSRTQAEALHDLAGLYDHLGKPSEAEQAFRRSLRLREELAVHDPADEAARRYLSRSYFSLALMLDHDSRWDEAEELYQQAVTLQEKLSADFPKSGEYQDELAHSLYELGYLLARTNRKREALQIYERIAAIREGLLNESPGNASYQYRLTASLNYLGALYRRANRLTEAERVGQRAVTVQEELVANHPGVPVYRTALVGSYINLGNLYMETLRLGEAERLYEMALRINEEVARKHSEQVHYVVGLGLCYECLGGVSRSRGDITGALARFDRAIEIQQSVIRQQPRNSECRRHLSETYGNRADALTRVGRLKEALADWEQSIALNDDPLEADNQRLGRAVTLAHSGDYHRALADAAKLTNLLTVSGTAHYRAACIEALSSSAVLRDPSLPPARAQNAGRTLREPRHYFAGAGCGLGIGLIQAPS